MAMIVPLFSGGACLGIGLECNVVGINNEIFTKTDVQVYIIER